MDFLLLLQLAQLVSPSLNIHDFPDFGFCLFAPFALGDASLDADDFSFFEADENENGSGMHRWRCDACLRLLLTGEDCGVSVSPLPLLLLLAGADACALLSAVSAVDLIVNDTATQTMCVEAGQVDEDARTGRRRRMKMPKQAEWGGEWGREGEGGREGNGEGKGRAPQFLSVGWHDVKSSALLFLYDTIRIGLVGIAFGRVQWSMWVRFFSMIGPVQGNSSYKGGEQSASAPLPPRPLPVSHQPAHLLPPLLFVVSTLLHTAHLCMYLVCVLVITFTSAFAAAK